MDIGCKIKQARLQAGLTQEQAAAALGVSRQTISNWETEKTYPDIISVVKMSDLYAVSLDQLLKGEAPADGYLDYLAESTDAVQSRRKLSLLLLTLSYLGIWAFSLIVFWFFTSGSDAMGYGIMFLWVLLPVTTLLISLLIGKKRFRRPPEMARLHRFRHHVHAGGIRHVPRCQHGGVRQVSPAVLWHAPGGRNPLFARSGDRQRPAPHCLPPKITTRTVSGPSHRTARLFYQLFPECRDRALFDARHLHL